MANTQIAHCHTSFFGIIMIAVIAVCLFVPPIVTDDGVRRYDVDIPFSYEAEGETIAVDGVSIELCNNENATYIKVYARSEGSCISLFDSSNIFEPTKTEKVVE